MQCLHVCPCGFITTIQFLFSKKFYYTQTHTEIYTQTYTPSSKDFSLRLGVRWQPEGHSYLRGGKLKTKQHCKSLFSLHFLDYNCMCLFLNSKARPEGMYDAQVYRNRCKRQRAHQVQALRTRIGVIRMSISLLSNT